MKINGLIMNRKRGWWHAAFWLVYGLQDALMKFTWAAPSLPALSETVRAGKALHAAAVVLLPKLILTYYVLYVALGRVLREKGNLLRVVGETTVVVICCIVVYRLAFNSYV